MILINIFFKWTEVKQIEILKRAAFHISAADTGTKNKYGFMFGLVDQAFKTGKQMWSWHSKVWCDHKGKLKNTFSTVMPSLCWQCSNRLPQKPLHVVTGKADVITCLPPKASIHESVTSTCTLKVKKILHAITTLVEINIKRAFRIPPIWWMISS